MFDSVYSIALSILRELGGDDTVKYDSTYSIALAILDVLGGDTTKKYDSVYSILLDIYKTRFGTVLSGMDSSYSILNEINKAFDPSDTSKYDSSYETLIAISEHMVPAGYVFEIVTDSANTVIINGVQRTSAQFETGTEVSWSVSRTGYVTQSGTYTMGEEDYSLTVTLVLDQFTYTIVPLPADATVVINEQQRSSITADYGTIITWTVSRTGYATQTGSFTLTEDRTDTIGLIANQYTLTINPTPNDATVVINGVERRSYTEDYGTAAVWSVSKAGYVTQSNTDILISDITRNITLVEVQYTFSIVPNPADATVMINGVAQSSVNVSDGATLTWSVSKTGYATQTGSYTIDGADHTENVDLSPLEFTVTITPDPFDATVIINRDERDIYTGVYGEEIEWEVSAEGFETQTGSFTLTEDTDLTVTLVSSAVTLTFNKGNANVKLVVNGEYLGTGSSTHTVTVNPGDSVHWEAYRSGYATRKGDLVASTSQTVDASLSTAPFVKGTATSSPTLQVYDGGQYVAIPVTYDSSTQEFYSSTTTLSPQYGLINIGSATEVRKLKTIELQQMSNLIRAQRMFENMGLNQNYMDSISFDSFSPSSAMNVQQMTSFQSGGGSQTKVLYLNNWDLSNRTSDNLQVIMTTQSANGTYTLNNLVDTKASKSGSVLTINDYPWALKEIHMNCWTTIPTPAQISSGQTTIPSGSHLLLYGVSSGKAGSAGWTGSSQQAFDFMKDISIDIYAYGWSSENITKLKNTLCITSYCSRSMDSMGIATYIYTLRGVGSVKIWIDGTHYWYWDITDQYTSSSFTYNYNPSTVYWYPISQWTLVDTTA